MSPTPRDIPGFLRFVLRRWSEDRCPQIAGSLTYTTLLALVPMFAVAVALLSSSPFFEEVMNGLKAWLLMNLLPDIAYRIITVYMQELAESAARLTWWGLAVVLGLAVWTMLTMDRAFNAIWRVSRARPYWVLVVGYLVVVVTGPLLLVASVTVTTYIIGLSASVPGFASSANALLLRLIPMSMSAVAFFLVYRIVPHHAVPARHAVLGAGVAAILFETAKEAFGYWVHTTPTYNLVYGAFAAFPVFLVWIYISWLVVLFGAELTACAAYWHDKLWTRAPTPAVRFREALAVTQALIKAGPMPMSFIELQEATLLPPQDLEEALAHLADGGVVAANGRKHYQLTPGTVEVLQSRPRGRSRRSGRG